VSTAARDIEAVLDESGPDYDSFDYERPTAGHQGEVFLVTLYHQGQEYEVVIKFQAGDPASFALEPYLHDYVADRTDIPVPHILVHKKEPTLDVPPYFVTERIEGQNLAESIGELATDVRESVVRQAGEILGDMHAEIGFEGFGRLALDDGHLIVEDLSWNWRNQLEKIVNSHIDALAGGPFERSQRQAREYLEQSIPVIPTGSVPRLVHDDFRPANLLYEPTASDPITAVLDWQFALAGDPEYHIARTEFLFVDPSFGDAETRQHLQDLLYQGYRQHREFDPGEAYEKRRQVYHFATLLWRMANFEAAFADYSELAKARAQAQFRQQFDTIASNLPEPED
jgi:aminoglycoside phosphotransferase (APT) family kinase protein